MNDLFLKEGINMSFDDRAERLEYGTEEALHTAGETAKRKLREIGQYASDLYEKGARKAKNAERSAENLVRENPWTSVLVSAGIGLGIGALFGLWMRPRR